MEACLNKYTNLSGLQIFPKVTLLVKWLYEEHSAVMFFKAYFFPSAVLYQMGVVSWKIAMVQVVHLPYQKVGNYLSREVISFSFMSLEQHM